jgi:5-formyltetrahydrofolate cyclo-ligase
VLAAPEFAAASRIALYDALPDEVPTGLLFEEVVARKGSAFLPRIGPEGTLEFAAVRAVAECVRGSFGAREPAGAAESLDPGDLVIVPGVAFDRAGRRLGRGGGHYDRTFPPGSVAPVLFGTAYVFQIVARLPEAAHDRGVVAIATERGLLRVLPGC